MATLNSSQISHNDLGPQNIQISNSGEFKIFPLSLISNTIGIGKTIKHSSRSFLAPEEFLAIYLKQPQNVDHQKADVFSFGMTILSLACLNSLDSCYSFETLQLYSDQIERYLASLNGRYSNSLINIIKQMITYDTDLRPTFQMLMNNINQAPQNEQVSSMPASRINNSPQQQQMLPSQVMHMQQQQPLPSQAMPLQQQQMLPIQQLQPQRIQQQMLRPQQQPLYTPQQQQMLPIQQLQPQRIQQQMLPPQQVQQQYLPLQHQSVQQYQRPQQIYTQPNDQYLAPSQYMQQPSVQPMQMPPQQQNESKVTYFREPPKVVMPPQMITEERAQNIKRQLEVAPLFELPPVSQASYSQQIPTFNQVYKTTNRDNNRDYNDYNQQQPRNYQTYQPEAENYY